MEIKQNNSNSTFSVRDLFFFDKLITSSFITFLFWLMLLGTIFSAIFTMTYSPISGLITLIVGVISARVFCELLIVSFKINEALQEIRKK